MKSRLFTTVFDDPEAENAKRFARHLRDMIDLDPVKQRVCLDALSQVRLARTATERNEFLIALAAKSGISRVSLEHGLSVCNFLADSLLSEAIPDDDFRLWADDLQELGYVDETSRPAFDALLDQLNLLSSDLEFLSRQQSAAGGVLPSFQALGCTVEVRPIQRKVFHWGQNVDDYTPEILGTVMVVSVHIGVDEGAVRDFYFQADETDIDNIIASLRAAKKEMAALGDFFRLDRIRKVRTDD